VQQEAAQELVDRQMHQTLFVAVRGVPPAEGDLAVRERDEPAVGDADAVGVGAEIAQGMFGSAEGTLGVDDPVVPEQASEPGGEAARLGEMGEMTMELDLAFAVGRLQTGDELATEDTSEHLDGQKEGTSGRDPAGVIACETASRDDAVDMWMMLQTLVPCMEHAEEADLGSEMTRVPSDLHQRGGTGTEEQAIYQPLVLKCQRSQFTRQREHRMDIAGRQKFALPLLQPS